MSPKSGESISESIVQVPLDITLEMIRTSGAFLSSFYEHTSLIALVQSTVATCKKHDIAINHAGRQVSTRDFTTFNYILASDESNLRNLRQMIPKSTTAELRLFGSYDDDKAIPDPYYGGIVGSHILPLLRSPTLSTTVLAEWFRAGIPAVCPLFKCVPRRAGRKTLTFSINLFGLCVLRRPNGVPLGRFMHDLATSKPRSFRLGHGHMIVALT